MTLSNAPRVLFFGTGSIGAVYAYIAWKAGAHVATVCRSNYAAAKANGFTIRSTMFGHETFRPSSVVNSVAHAVSLDPGPWDYIVVCSKSLPGLTPSQASLLAPAVTANTAIALVQNGIAIEDEYAQLYPQNALLSCVAYLPATQTAPAVVAHKEVELLHVGTFPADAPAAHKRSATAFAGLLRAGGATVELHQDIQLERWKKLIVNAAWNPVCALSRCRDAEFLASSPQAVEHIRDVMAEVSLVAQAEGYPQINQAKIDYQISRATARPLPGVEPSMLADAVAGRRMEVEAIVGNTVKLAEHHGLGDRVPRLKNLYYLINALDRRPAQ